MPLSVLKSTVISVHFSRPGTLTGQTQTLGQEIRPTTARTLNRTQSV